LVPSALAIANASVLDRTSSPAAEVCTISTQEFGHDREADELLAGDVSRLLEIAEWVDGIPPTAVHPKIQCRRGHRGRDRLDHRWRGSAGGIAPSGAVRSAHACGRNVRFDVRPSGATEFRCSLNRSLTDKCDAPVVACRGITSSGLRRRLSNITPELERFLKRSAS
jgi:hypothetical protein